MGDGRSSSHYKEGSTMGSPSRHGGGGSSSSSVRGTPQRKRSHPHNSIDRGYFSESEVRIPPHKGSSHYIPVPVPVDSARKAGKLQVSIYPTTTDLIN